MKSNRNERHSSAIPTILTLSLFLVAIGPSIVGLSRALTACQVWATAQETESALPDEMTRELIQDIPTYARAESNTYLTLPEWYIVYSTDEYAAFIANNPPSQFPYFKSVGQYWDSYVNVCTVIKGKYASNSDYHATLGIIGFSFTAENMIKGMYEMTIGRLAEATSNGEATQEEIYARVVAKEYGEFLHVTPWYLFPFKEKLQGLWNETDNSGPNLIRKWERKIALTLEYGSKMLYGGLLNYAANATYGGPDTSKIYAVTEGVTSDLASADLEIIKDNGQRQLIYITRFEAFTKNVPGLTERGLRFVEIAGNDELLFTLIGPADLDYSFQNGKYLFKLPILTQPGLARLAIQVRVADVHLFLEELKSRSDVQFEHIYDY